LCPPTRRLPPKPADSDEAMRFGGLT
jgi:hypothetical protein